MLQRRGQDKEMENRAIYICKETYDDSGLILTACVCIYDKMQNAQNVQYVTVRVPADRYLKEVPWPLGCLVQGFMVLKPDVPGAFRLHSLISANENPVSETPPAHLPSILPSILLPLGPLGLTYDPRAPLVP